MIRSKKKDTSISPPTLSSSSSSYASHTRYTRVPFRHRLAHANSILMSVIYYHRSILSLSLYLSWTVRTWIGLPLLSSFFLPRRRRRAQPPTLLAAPKEKPRTSSANCPSRELIFRCSSLPYGATFPRRFVKRRRGGSGYVTIDRSMDR